MPAISEVQPFDVQGPLTRIGQNIQQTLGSDIPGHIQRGVETYKGLKQDERADAAEARDQQTFDFQVDDRELQAASLEKTKELAMSQLQQLTNQGMLTGDNYIAAEAHIRALTDKTDVGKVMANALIAAESFEDEKANGFGGTQLSFDYIAGAEPATLRETLKTRREGQYDAKALGLLKTEYDLFTKANSDKNPNDLSFQDFSRFLASKSADSFNRSGTPLPADPDAKYLWTRMLTNDKYKTAAQSMFGDPKFQQAMELEGLKGKNDLAAAQARATSFTEKAEILTIDDYAQRSLENLKMMKESGILPNNDLFKTEAAQSRRLLNVMNGIATGMKIPQGDAVNLTLRMQEASVSGDVSKISMDEMNQLKQLDGKLYTDILKAVGQRTGAPVKTNAKGNPEYQIPPNVFGPSRRYGQEQPIYRTTRTYESTSGSATPAPALDDPAASAARRAEKINRTGADSTAGRPIMVPRGAPQ